MEGRGAGMAAPASGIASLFALLALGFQNSFGACLSVWAVGPGAWASRCGVVYQQDGRAAEYQTIGTWPLRP